VAFPPFNLTSRSSLREVKRAPAEDSGNRRMQRRSRRRMILHRAPERQSLFRTAEPLKNGVAEPEGCRAYAFSANSASRTSNNP
jgi:hypothetical protein